MRRIDLEYSYPNPASLGAGILVRLARPEGWCLADIGLDDDGEYMVGFDDAWENLHSTWKGPRSTSEKAMYEYEMDPVVLADVAETVIVDTSNREHRTIRTPTGWIEAVGRFHRLNEPDPAANQG